MKMVLRHRNNKAQVIIETALFIGIIVLLFFAVFQLALGYIATGKLASVARDAARFATVVPGLNDTAGNDAWLSLMVRIDRCLVALNIHPADVSRTITWGRNTGDAARRGDRIRVELSMPYPVVLDINMAFIQDLKFLRVYGTAFSERLL
jgi:hypothetical protein